jgi:hypothetical protein
MKLEIESRSQWRIPENILIGTEKPEKSEATHHPYMWYKVEVHYV